MDLVALIEHPLSSYLASVAVVAVFLGAALLQRRRVAKALAATISDSACIACNSEDLESTSEGTYRCRSCGYDGGSGQAARQREERRQQIASWSAEKRRAALINELSDARRLVLSAQGTLAGARSLSKLDIIGMGGQHSLEHDLNDKQKLAYRGLGEIQEARTHLSDLSLFADSSITITMATPNDVHMEFDQFFDNILSDLRMHGKIGEFLEHSKTLLREVDRVLADCGEHPNRSVSRGGEDGSQAGSREDDSP